MTTTAKKILVSLCAAIIIGIYVLYQQSFGANTVSATSAVSTQPLTQDTAPNTLPGTTDVAGNDPSTGDTQAPAPAAIVQPAPATTKKTVPVVPTTPAVASGSSPSSNQASGKYKNGTYTGSAVSAFYGPIQVRVTISGGAIADVKAVQYPNDRGQSVEISNESLPVLRREALKAQSANIDIVSGATDTSEAYQQSLASALAQA